MVGLIVAGGLVFLEERSGLLKEGSPAPEFTATLSTGETVSLGDYRGKKNVVLFFYPRDFTPGCTEQVCSLRDNYADIIKLDAVIFGVSRDDRSSHAEFIATHHLPFSLISDVNKSVIRLFAVERLWGLVGVPKRVTYVIDKRGIIRLVSHHEVLIGKHIEEVVAALQHLE